MPSPLSRVVAAVALAVAAIFVATPAQADVTGTFRNPLGTAPDPFMTYYDGNYYLLEVTNGGFSAAKSASLANLLTAPRTKIWTGDAAGRDRDLWAPSLYLFGGHWYLYYTADDGIDENHRQYVAESENSDPLSQYHFKNRLAAPGAEETFAIDGDVLVQGDGSLSFVWSGAGSEGHNLLYLAPMSNPWTISGPRTYLPADGGCSEVREAPTFLRHDNRNYLVYSTCDTGKPDYQLWMMSIDVNANPRDPANWVQNGQVFTRNDGAGVYGPGSNNFFTSPDGTETWIAYHGKNTTTFTYNGRTTRAQRISFNADGSPNLGSPLGAGATQDLPSGDPGGGPYWINDDNRSSGAGSVRYDGAWNSGGGCGAQCFWGDDHWSDQGGATVTWTFTGTRIALLSVRDVGNGIAAMSVDGAPELTVDYYAGIRQGEQVNYISPTLGYGVHTLRVRVTGDHNGSSAASFISIDRAEIYTN